MQQIVFKIDSIKKISSTTNLKETLLISFKDSLRLDTALLNSNEGNLTNRILLIKEANSEDYWKYIIPVLTLLLGIAVNKGLDYFSERKRIKKVGKRWIAELRCLELPIRSQIESLEAFVKEHDVEKFEIPVLTIFSILDCEMLKSMDKSDFLEFIEKNKTSNSLLSEKKNHDVYKT